MAASVEELRVSLADCERLIRQAPCFADLSSTQIQALALLMREQVYHSGEKIVSEHDLVDSVYFIVSGDVEVTRAITYHRREKQVPVAVLHPGESIGLSDTGFYSPTGKRTATVTALTTVHVLRLDVDDLYEFLKENKLENAFYTSSLRMLSMRLVKQSLPFTTLPYERLAWLVNHLDLVHVAAGEFILTEGEKGDACYLIRSGEVEIFITAEDGSARRLALLKSPMCFGESTFMTRMPRNASARAISDCELLKLSYEHLSELMETERNVAGTLMTLMVNRSRPLPNPRVTIHQRVNEEGQQITILKNPDNGSYFQLVNEGIYIWQQLNGKQTLRDITLNVAEKFNLFAPDIVAGLISKLARGGFIENVKTQDLGPAADTPLWIRIIDTVRNLNARLVFGDMDGWITRAYKAYVRYLFTRPMRWLLSLIMIAGFVGFIVSTPPILHFFDTRPNSLWLLLLLIPLSFIEVILHELGHAFAVKACGREVHYMGVGWSRLLPVAFIDTSDMWLSSRKPRMFVNLAGIYTDLIVAGIAALFSLVTPWAEVQAVLWLFAIYTYISAFQALSPLQEVDGYYVLMDGLGKNHLRHAAVKWLIEKFPKSLRNPSLFLGHKAEVVYWLACIIFLIAVSVLTYEIQRLIIDVFNIPSFSHSYLTLILPFLIVILSSLEMIVEIKSQVE